MATPGALANINADELIERVANGAITQHIARELGVHHSNLYRKLAQHPEYQAARECGMEARLDQAEMDIQNADERTLPRAREVWRAVTWRAEREHRHRWGNGPVVQVSQGAAQAGGQPAGIQIVFIAAQQSQPNVEHCINGESQVVDK